MKSIVFAVSAVVLAASASATEVNMNYVRDLNLDKNGVRVAASVGSGALKPELAVVHVSDSYTRYSAGANYDLLSIGAVKVSVGGAGVYQNTQTTDSGVGLNLGVKTSVNLMKNVSLDARVEQFVGHKKVSAFDGTTVMVGASYRF